MIAPHGKALRRLDREVVPALFLGRIHITLDDIARRRCQIKTDQLHAKPAPLGARHGKQVVHQPVHPIDLTLDRREIPIE